MGPAPNLFFSQRGKPALYLIKPRSGCWSEMDIKNADDELTRRARSVCCESRPTGTSFGRSCPSPDARPIEGRVRFDRTQEHEELSAAMAPVRLADDFSGGDIRGREQRRRAIAFVILRMAHGYAGGNGRIG